MRQLALLAAVVPLFAACGSATPPVAQLDDLPAASAPADPPQSPRAPAAACVPAPGGTHAPCYDTGPAPTVFPLAVVEDVDDLVRLPTTVAHVEPAAAAVVVRVEYPDGCQQLRGAALEETPETVTVYAVGTAPTGGPCVLRLAYGSYRVELSAPLGGRQVRTTP